MDNPEALFVGKKIIYFDEIESTSDYAVDLISKINPPEGTCVLADYQSCGRGQIGRSWYSSANQNLLLSYLIYPFQIPIDQQYYLNMMASLAVFDTLKVYGFEPKIKWPNDIYIKDKKVCGILIQNILRGDQIKASVIGIGLNVNESNFPAQLPNATSLFMESEIEYDRMEILAALNKKIEWHYLLLKSIKWEAIPKMYISHLYRLDVSSQFETSDLGMFYAKITGVDSQGRLCLHTDDGKILQFRHGEIKYII